jgi:hypothetical protein
VKNEASGILNKREQINKIQISGKEKSAKLKKPKEDSSSSDSN